MEEVKENNKIEILSISSDKSQTFIFKNEDHTLGNSLRSVLMKKFIFKYILEKM